VAAGAVVLALTGACADGARQETPSTSARPDDGVRSLEARPAERAGPPDAERPVSLRLPSGTLVPVRPAGTRGRGLLDVPDDIAEAGWWRAGARLGDPFGSTLIAGHVDAVDQGLGSFAELLAVRHGQRVLVRSRGLEQAFTIRSRELVPRSRLRDAPRIYSVRGARRLTLVTCAPPYLADRGGYQNLAVVTAIPVGSPRPRSRP
jgi:hypothetical protein